MGKLGKKCPKWGVLGCFWPFLSVFVSHETQPPRRIVPRGTYIFAPFFTLLGVFHMKRRFYYIFAIFNEILVSCETSVLCGFVAFYLIVRYFSRCFSSKMACETIYPPRFSRKSALPVFYFVYKQTLSADLYSKLIEACCVRACLLQETAVGERLDIEFCFSIV